MQNSYTDKKTYITYLTVISTIAVVFLHANSCFWVFTYDSYWLGANIVESLMYFAVPVFFMISGANLIDYRDRYSTREFFVKRFNKTVIPFFVWSVVAFISVYCMGLIEFPKIPVFIYILNGIIGHEFIGIYWFFIPLFNIYLAMPLFSAVVKEKRRQVFLYLIFVELILDNLLDYLNYFYIIRFKRGELEMGALTGPLMYALIGYMLSHYKISKKWRIVIYLLGATGFFTMLFGTYLASIRFGAIVEDYKGYYRILTVMYSSAVFLFIKQFSEMDHYRNEKIERVLEKFASYSFPIYLIHFYFMQIMINVFNMDDTKWSYRVGAAVISIIGSIIVAFILRRIPILRRIVPS